AQMQQGSEFCHRIEGSALAPLGGGGSEEGCCGDVLTELLELVRLEHEPPDQQRRGVLLHERGEQSSYAPPVKVRERETTAPQLPRDDTGDEESGDDEEDVDTDVASRDDLREGVKSQHGQHCH